MGRLRASVAEGRRRLMVLVDPKRRFNCADQDDPSWHERAETAVRLFSGSRNRKGRTVRLEVADLGCGNERLRSVLQQSLAQPFDYQGYDLHPSRRVSSVSIYEQDCPIERTTPSSGSAFSSTSMTSRPSWTVCA